jgi:hypothetical protein
MALSRRKSVASCEVSARHNAVKDALYRAVLLTGGQAMREVTGLQRKSHLRPDLQIVYPGRHVHPLAVYGRSQPGNSTATAKDMEGKKRRKYAAIASRHDAEFIPFAVEASGGLGPEAFALLDLISGAASEHLSLWLQEDAVREILNSVAHRHSEGQRHDHPQRSGRCCSPSGLSGTRQGGGREEVSTVIMSAAAGSSSSSAVAANGNDTLTGNYATQTNSMTRAYAQRYFDDFCALFTITGNDSIESTVATLHRIEEWYNRTFLFISLITGIPLTEIHFSYGMGAAKSSIVNENKQSLLHNYAVAYGALLRMASTLRRPIPAQYRPHQLSLQDPLLLVVFAVDQPTQLAQLLEQRDHQRDLHLSYRLIPTVQAVISCATIVPIERERRVAAGVTVYLLHEHAHSDRWQCVDCGEVDDDEARCRLGAATAFVPVFLHP